MRGEGSSRRQAAVIAAVLVAAVAVPKALADDSTGVPVDGAALAAVAISASTPTVPQAPPVQVVPETGSVSTVSPVIPPAVSPPPPPPPPPDAGSPAGTPQSPAGEPSGGGSQPDAQPPPAPPASGAIENATASISSSITAQGRVILRSAAPDMRPQNARRACTANASCKVPESHPRGAAAASARGGVRELPPSRVTTTELARGRTTHHPGHAEHHKPRKPRPARRTPGGAGSGPVPLVPEPPGRSPEAPPPSAMTFSSAGAHGTGSFTVSASVTAFGVAAALALSTAARLLSVPMRRRERDDRLDRPG
jgi:hypothetical protein